MRLSYPYLLLALVLLWLPLALLLGRHRRRELRNPARGALVTLPSLLRSPWAWFDLLRAGGAVWVMLHLIQLPLLPTDKPQSHHASLVLVGGQLLALALGVWIQTMGTGSRRLRLAPLFYLLGITIALLPWQVWLFGGALGLALTGMLRRWQVVFWLLPASLLAMAALFRTLELKVAFVAALYVLPGLLGLRHERPLSWVFTPVRDIPVEEKQPRRRRRHRNENGGPELNDGRRPRRSDEASSAKL
jgi:hypothetical protein